MELLGSELEGSPFVVRVSDGSVNASTSHAYGVGLSHATAGDAAYFTVQARDAAGNNRTTGGDALTVTVMSDMQPAADYFQVQEAAKFGPQYVSSVSSPVAIEYLVNGTYRVNYNATRMGNTTVHVTIGGIPIAGSPFRPYVSPGVAYAPACHAVGDGLSAATASSATDAIVAPVGGGTTQVSVSNITVYARDRFGNLLDRGGDQFLVRLVGPTMFFVRLQDAGRGRYTAEYIPSFLGGEYDMSIALLNGYMTDSGGGLWAEFFTDLSMRSGVGYPAAPLSRIDRTVNTAVASTFRSVRWSGLVVPVATGPYHFVVRTEPTISVLPRLRVNGIQLVDVREGYTADGVHNNGTLPLIGGVPYNITVEVTVLNSEGGSVQLLWAGPGLPGVDTVPRVVPASRLAPVARHIDGSPFRVNVSQWS